MRSIKIDNFQIGDDSAVYIIAELSANHNQDFALAVKTIRAMKEAGADAVKIQTYTPDSMTLDSDQPIFQTRQDTIWAGRKLYDLYKEAYTPWDWQPKLKKIANDLGMAFFSSPFDVAAVDFLEKMQVPAYKIASLEITDIPLIQHVASKGKPLIISTGAAKLEDIALAVETCRNAGNHQIALLKCTTAYPTPPEEVHLNNIPTLYQTFNTVVGLSDHTLGIEAPVVAVALGAKIIEKHFILDKSLGGPDALFSLEASEFKKMVNAVRTVEKMLGTQEYIVTEKMDKSRKSLRTLYAVQNIKRGEPFTKNNIKSLRPGYGLHPKHYVEILQKKAAIDIPKGTPLRWHFFTE